MLSCLVYFHITYLILSCTFIYILILFIYCSFICLLPVSSLFHVVSHVSILCLWHMLYLYFSYIHIHTCTIAYIHILSVIYFMLSYTFITFHVFSYDIHILCFSDAFHILYFSYDFHILCFSYAFLFYTLYCSYTFHVLSSCTLPLVLVTVFIA